MSDKANNKAKDGGKKRWLPSRRQFLIGLGTGTAVLAVGVVLGGPTIVREARLRLNQAFLTGEAPAPEMPKSPTIWFQIDADNTAHLFIPKIEMGQGIHTTLAQIAADELELDWETVQVHQADTSRGFDPNLIFTFGSTSTTVLYTPMREIAAMMREMLRGEAAKHFNVAVDEIVAEGSTCYAKANPDSRVTYGELVAAKQGEWVVPETQAALKRADQFRYIGNSVQRVDFYEKLTGRAEYGYDKRLPNMLYGAVARPPRYGATLKQAAAGTAGEQPGVVAVVIEDQFAGVLAETRIQAYNALAFLDLEWEGGTTISQEELEQLVTVTADGGILIQREGDFSGAIGTGEVVSAEYRTPMAAHAHLEPQAGLADVQPNAVMIYASTQAPDITQDSVAKRLGVDAKTVTVVPTYLGGAFGRKTGADAAVEAAVFSKAAGRPVHVGWNRTEEMRYGYRRPLTHHVLRASLDANGRISAFEHQLASGDVFFYISSLTGSSFLETMLGADPLAAYGSLVNYAVPNVQVIYHRRKLPVPTGFWRGLGSFPNTFAMESFMDELAHAAGIDPIEFHLNHLPQSELGERMRVATEAVAQASDWANLGGDTLGKGFALTYDRGTVVALVMTVSIENNRARPRQAWCAIDPGLVVNPDGARAQVEGSIVMSLSSVLNERLTVENGMISNENFHQYPLITMMDTPEIEVIPLQSSDEPIGGLGEPVVGAVPAAMGNAVFNLTGQRLRQLPFELA